MITENNVKETIIDGILWRGTGEIVDQVSIYDWEEIVEGEDELGNTYKASATISMGEIIEIHGKHEL